MAKKTPRQRAEEKAWRACANYIKERDSWTCFTCGKVAYGREMNAGHMFSRSKKIIKYDYRNIHAQCVHCNQYLSGNLHVYVKRFKERYGKQLYNYFYSIRNNAKKRSIEDLEKIALYYRAKLKNLPAHKQCRK